AWDAVVAAHLKGRFNMSRHACEYWREEHKKGNLLNGRVIMTSSDAGLLGNVGQSNYGACKAALAVMAVIIGQEMKKYGVTANAIAPVARTRLTVDATPSTAAPMGQEPKPGGVHMFHPANHAPLVAWLASDEAAGVNGQVFRVGGRSVWPMKGWHSAARIKNPEPAAWDAKKLGARIKEEIAKGITAPETMGDIFAGGLGAARGARPGGGSSSSTPTRAGASSPRRCSSGCSPSTGMRGWSRCARAASRPTRATAASSRSTRASCC